MKVREYASFDLYCESNSSEAWEEVAIVTQKSRLGTIACADLMTECKSWKTAVRRFFKALNCDERFASWEDDIVECVKGGWWSDKSTIYNPDTGKSEFTGDYSWGVENLGDNTWYVFLNVRTETE